MTVPSYTVRGVLEPIKHKISKEAYNQLERASLSSEQLTALAIAAGQTRSPKVAGVLHFVIAFGVGHFYARLYMRGVIYLITYLAVMMIFGPPIVTFNQVQLHHDLHMPAPTLLMIIWYWIEVFLVPYSTREKNSKILCDAVGLKYESSPENVNK